MLRLAALALCLVVSSAAANEAQIRKVLERKLGAVRIEGVVPAPVAGLWEVRYRTPNGMQVVYTDAAATYIIQGRIYDLQNDKDLTDERLRKLNAIRFDSLPLELAVKVTRGSGKRVLAMFSDPYCPACRQFERSLAQLEDLTVYVFMYPVIRPENADHSRAVWCSSDRAKAWLELAAAPQPKVPEAGTACADPVDKVLALGRKLGVNSTPTLFLTNGERLSGGLGARELRELLDEVAAEAAKERSAKER